MRAFFLVLFALLLPMLCSASDVIIKHNPPVNVIEESLLKDMQSSSVVQTSLVALDKAVNFPYTLTIVYGETPKNALRSGPYYSQDKISIPYRYVFQLRKYLRKRKHIHRYQDIDKLTFAFLIFVLLHEAGHALIDQHSLPIIGREEDVADNFAAYVLLNFVKNGEAFLKAAAIVFDLKSRTGKNINNDQMQGEHRLHKQRYYSLMCFLSAHTSQYSATDFDESRVVRCNREYKQLQSGWNAVLRSLQNR